MSYAIKPLPCDPTRIKGMSERLIVSHHENNYGGAVNRLNAITAQLAQLDFDSQSLTPHLLKLDPERSSAVDPHQPSGRAGGCASGPDRCVRGR